MGKFPAYPVGSPRHKKLEILVALAATKSWLGLNPGQNTWSFDWLFGGYLQQVRRVSAS